MNLLTRVLDAAKGKVPLSLKRSPLWPRTRHKHLQEQPACAACGGTKKLEVHHKEPFHINPALELDPNNLITLCEDNSYGVSCHLFFGHSGDFHSFNPNVEADAAACLDRLTHRP